MLDRRRVQAMLQQQQQLQAGFGSLGAGMLPSFGSSGAMRGSGSASAGSSGRKGSRLSSPAGVPVVGSSSAPGSLPMELPALPAAAEVAEGLQTDGSGAAGAVAAAKHRRTDSLLAAAGKRVSVCT
jgi:hypothetical protein